MAKVPANQATVEDPMPRIALALVAVALTLVSVAHSADRTRYSGRIKEVTPSHQSITLQELGPGMELEKGRVVDRRIVLTPDTQINLATRAGENETTEWPGGFKESPLPAGDLRVGDYATAETEAKNGRLIAISIVVIRPTGPSR
ncbi:MAG: hypothetical protein DMD82_13985 [Candidatus Rokuibacteriota bacterium]|nr:MAG: hypothetical protein DMD82_13985 [Candidatus Rokubacteria bacterium]